MRRTEFSKLAKEAGLLRVDGIRPVKINSTIPTVGVFFTRVKYSLDTNKYESINRKCFITFPASSLRYFTPGSVWKSGKQVHVPSAIPRQYKIKTSQVIHTIPSEPLQLNGEDFSKVIPSRVKLFGQNKPFLINSPIVVVPSIDDLLNQSILVIPEHELFRFYYGVSDRFVNRLTSSDYLNKYIDYSKSLSQKYMPEIFLNRRLSRLESLVAFRMLVDKLAERVGRNIHKKLKTPPLNSTLKGENNSNIGLNYYCDFPFKGDSILNISGSSYKVNSTSSQREFEFIYVRTINQCSAPLPFKDPVIKHDFKLDPKKQENEDKNADEGFPFLQEGKAAPEEKPSIGDEPTNKRLKSASSYTPSNRFTSIKYFKPKYINENAAENSDFKKRQRVDVEEDSIGEQNNEKDSKNRRKLSGFDTDVDGAQSNRMKLFISLIKSIRKRQCSWEIKTKAINSSVVEDNESITFLPKPDSMRSKWHMIDSTRTRQIICCEINLDNSFYYLFELELKGQNESAATLLLSSKSNTSLDNKEINKILDLVVKCRHWPSSNIARFSSDEGVEQYEDDYFQDRISRPQHSDKNVSDYTEDEIGAWAGIVEEAIGKLIPGMIVTLN